MNVLWLAPHPIPDTNNKHPAPWITSLAEKLVNRGLKITVLTVVNNLGQDVCEYDFNSYRLIALNVPSRKVDLMTLFTKRISIVNKYLSGNVDKFDLIHVHGTEHQYASGIDKEIKKRIPVIISIQGLLFQYKRYINDVFTIRRVLWELGAIYEKKEIRNNSNFFCRTHWDKGWVLNQNPKAHVYEAWELMRKEFYDFKLSGPGKNILFSGGSFSIKGLKQALKVFDKLLAEHNIKLHVIGNCSWSYVSEVKEKFHLERISSDNVILHGMVNANQILTLFNDSCCLYHPSLIDNSPNSICEAQLVGLPVLAANTGGVSSLINDGVTGILLDNKNEESDYLKLTKFLSDPGLQQQISVNAKAVATQRHSEKSILDSVINGYNQITKA
jgi:glycosyltransferase involved in cell wall biosynthesis